MYPGPCGTSGLQTHATRTLVHLGSLGVWGSYKIAVSTKYIMTRTKAHFNGISNPSNQSISSFLFPAAPAASCPAASLLDPELIFEVFGEFRSFNLLYSVSSWSCQDPGRKIFGGVLPFSNREVSQERPAPRCVLKLEQKTAENGIFI